MAKKKATTTQFREIVRRLNYESGRMNTYLEKAKFTQPEMDWVSAAAQTSPKTVLTKVEKTMLARVQDPKKIPGLLGPVKRCINNIKRMTGRYTSLSRTLQKKGIDFRAIEKEVLAAV